VWQLHKEKAEKRTMNSGESAFQSLTLNLQVKDFY